MATVYSIDEGGRWNGARVLRAKLMARDVAAHLPTFTRTEFGTAEGINENLEVVWREPHEQDTRRIPLATVSKRYALLQHTDLVRQLVDAIDNAVENSSSITETTLLLSEYGERMECAFTLKGHSFDPGDGYPILLRLFLRNSVDGSCAFEVSLRWLRLVCSNGMTVLTRHDTLRAIHHLDRMSAIGFKKFLATRIPAATSEADLYRKWASTSVPQIELLGWIRRDVKKQWGIQAAARVLHICGTGYDGRVGRTPEKKKVGPDELLVSSDTRVPGANVPAATLYDVYQALTWVASRRTNIEDQESWGSSALVLARSLDKMLTRSGDRRAPRHKLTPQK